MALRRSEARGAKHSDGSRTDALEITVGDVDTEVYDVRVQSRTLPGQSDQELRITARDHAYERRIRDLLRDQIIEKDVVLVRRANSRECRANAPRSARP